MFLYLIRFQPPSPPQKKNHFYFSGFCKLHYRFPRNYVKLAIYTPFFAQASFLWLKIYAIKMHEFILYAYRRYISFLLSTFEWQLKLVRSLSVSLALDLRCYYF